MEEQFYRDVSEQSHETLVEDFISAYFSNSSNDPPASFDNDDLILTLCRQNKRKAPGPDRIGAIAMLILPALAVDILDLYNSYFRLSYFPCLWENANVVMLPKPKNSLPVVSKVLKKLLLTRILPEMYSLIPPNSLGSIGSSLTLPTPLTTICP